MLVFVFIISLVLGSFINCLIYRLYKNESIWGRSYCPSCRNKIAWYDNIPVISFVMLKAKCRSCRKDIPWQYPLVELITAILLTFSFFKIFGSLNFYNLVLNGFSFNISNILLLIRDWFFILSLIIVFVYDLKWQEIPMLVVWPASITIFIINFVLVENIGSLILSAVIGLSFFLIQYLATSKKGLGEGDIWLGLLIGTFFANWQLLLVALFVSYIIGAIVSLYILKKKKNIKLKVPLGPFLVAGSIIVLFFGFNLLNYYLGLFPCC